MSGPFTPQLVYSRSPSSSKAPSSPQSSSNRIHSRSKRRKARLSASVAHGPPQDCVGHRGSFCHDRSRGPSCGPRSHGESRITHKKRRGGRGPPWPCPGAANCLPHPRRRRRRARLLQRRQRIHRLDPRPVAREPLAGRPRRRHVRVRVGGLCHRQLPRIGAFGRRAHRRLAYHGVSRHAGTRHDAVPHDGTRQGRLAGASCRPRCTQAPAASPRSPRR